MIDNYGDLLDPLKNDAVNCPGHYLQGDVECIDAIKAAVTGKPAYEAWLVGQVIKYLWRYNFKNGSEDVEKAQFYLNRLVEEVTRIKTSDEIYSPLNERQAHSR